MDRRFDKPENKQLDRSRYTSDAHKVAMAKLKLECSRASGESAATSTTIGRLLSSIDDETRERMAIKFDACYMMAKESLPFTKYPWNSNLAMELTWAQRTARQTQRSPSLATLPRASARTS